MESKRVGFAFAWRGIIRQASCYRSEKLTHYQAAQLLGLTRFEFAFCDWRDDAALARSEARENGTADQAHLAWTMLDCT